MPATGDSSLAERLSQSEIVLDYERAFSEATGMPLKFELQGRKRPMLRGGAKTNAFCEMMAKCAPGCQMCAETQQRLQAGSNSATSSTQCRAGLIDSAVPVKAGETILGYLTTGQITHRPTKAGNFTRIVEWLRNGGIKMDWVALEKAYHETRVMSHRQYDAVLRLLEVFASHLSYAAERIATEEANAEPAAVAGARQYVKLHRGEPITLTQVAQAAHVSTFHFCKMFKQATGLTFTHYLSLTRIAHAKNLLANPQLRISEIAYEAGFGSLTQFNRVFRRYVGQSPTEFRRKSGGIGR
ncbi:MAG: helix-turn-helix domain-containing protein [Chthoniobacter sp.]|uniref:helix-turn-helix domain-containing protein n=1 Tax=Chthoniobacter sp. TaxID=2510640 RepID=UPI0032A87CDA